MKQQTKTKAPAFELVGEVEAADVPNWTRRPQKYGQIIEALEKLEIGRSMIYRFPNAKAASQARNTIRDYLNREVATAIHEGKEPPIPGMVTTRIVADEERGGDNVLAYFTMSPSEGVINAPKHPPKRK